MTTAIATIAFPKKQFIQEGSWGGGHAFAGQVQIDHDLLYETSGFARSLFIESGIFLALDMVEHIGLETEGKRVVGYDGVMQLPAPGLQVAAALLGYTIAKDVI